MVGILICVTCLRGRLRELIKTWGDRRGIPWFECAWVSEPRHELLTYCFPHTPEPGETRQLLALLFCNCSESHVLDAHGRHHTFMYRVPHWLTAEEKLGLLKDTDGFYLTHIAALHYLLGHKGKCGSVLSF